MKHADPNDLVAFVTNVVGASSLADRFDSVEVEASDYADDGEFIRILVHLKDLDKISEDDVDTIASSIEEEVSKYDDRFPSVRFSDP